MNRILAVHLVAALALAACSVQPDPNGNEAEKFEARVQAGDPVAVQQRQDQMLAERIKYTDPVTGCDYMSPTTYTDNTMPRIDRDGFHVYCADQKERDRREAAGEPALEAPAE